MFNKWNFFYWHRFSFFSFVNIFFSSLLSMIYYFGSLNFGVSKNICKPNNMFFFSLPVEENKMSEVFIFFHDIHITSILIFILILVLIVFMAIYTVSETSKIFTHSFSLEMCWIFFPMILLILIGIPSLTLLYELEDTPFEESLSFKSTGFQWFWTYDFSKNSNQMKFIESYMIDEDENDALTNLNSNSEMIIPPFIALRNLVTSGDVMHSWTLPSEGIKTDAIPGRINQINMLIDEKEKKYVGQCSELCGVNHSFMPIILKTKN